MEKEMVFIPHIYVFDVNETLLDLAALDPLFAEAFGDPGTRPHKVGTDLSEIADQLLVKDSK